MQLKSKTKQKATRKKRSNGNGSSLGPVSALGGLLGTLFKSAEDDGEAARQRFESAVASVNALESTISKLSDSELRSKTGEFKERVAKGELLDSILPVSLERLSS
jgi:hypothetical protein